jgi:hypothetical protein
MFAFKEVIRATSEMATFISHVIAEDVSSCPNYDAGYLRANLDFIRMSADRCAG